MAKKRDLTLLVGGGILAFFGYRLLTGAADKFTSGLSYDFKNLRLKLTGTNVALRGTLVVNNTNSFGVSVNSFIGQLLYGKNGLPLLPINVTGFNLAPQAASSSDFESKINLFSLGANITSIISAIVSGQLKRLYVAGTLRTNIVAIPVNAEVSVLSE